MEKRHPAHELDELDRIIGTWHGENTLHKTKWTPAGEATATYSFKRALDGFFVVCDYFEDGGMDLHGLGVIGFDAQAGEFTLHWFDNAGIPPTQPGRAVLEGNTLAFEHDLPGHLGRTVFVLGDDALEFRVEMKLPDEPDWIVAVEGRYTRDHGVPAEDLAPAVAP